MARGPGTRGRHSAGAPPAGCRAAGVAGRHGLAIKLAGSLVVQPEALLTRRRSGAAASAIAREDLMPLDEFTEPITEGRFRERRAYLSAAAFADPGDGRDDPTDLIDSVIWMHLMDSPTDVLLQSTDHFGSTFRAMRSLADMWISAIVPDGSDLPLVFDAYLDAYDEFEAAPFIAAHGWYRQAASGLRNALEVMAHAARFVVRGDQAGYAAWRDDTAHPPNFGNSADLISQRPSIAAIETTLAAGGLFGLRPDGVMRDLYQELCRFAHGRPGHTNADIWESNGPVFAPDGFTRSWRDFRDTFLACTVLLKLAYPGLEMPGDLPEVARHAGAPWHGLAPSAVAAYFPSG